MHEAMLVSASTQATGKRQGPDDGIGRFNQRALQWTAPGWSVRLHHVPIGEERRLVKYLVDDSAVYDSAVYDSAICDHAVCGSVVHDSAVFDSAVLDTEKGTRDMEQKKKTRDCH